MKTTKTIKTIRVRTKPTSYPVIIGPGALTGLRDSLKKKVAGGRLFVIYDANLYALHGQTIRRSLGVSPKRISEIVIPSGERVKSARTLARLYDFLLSEKIARNDFILACGGGVTSDLAGYTAATTLRGIRWGIVSTTLLGMVDASIGGKTGINHALGKNLIGAFWQPSFVISDINLLPTLSRRELVCGLGEVVKTVGLVGGKELSLLRQYLDAGSLFDPVRLGQLVASCAAYKAGVVERDEREGGFRMVLNLGHTFAHGIEKALGYGRLLHGEAVILGLEAALNLGERLGHTSPSLGEYRSLVQDLMTLVPKRKIESEPVLSAMKLDKKRIGADQLYVVLKRVGRPKVCDGVSRTVARAALNEMLGRYRELGGRSA